PPSAPARGEGASINRIPTEPSRMSFPSQWKPEQDQPGERRPDMGTVFPRPSPVDQKPGPESPGFGGPVGQVPKPPQASQTPFPVRSSSSRGSAPSGETGSVSWWACASALESA